jgi:hypothetical protein
MNGLDAGRTAERKSAPNSVGQGCWDIRNEKTLLCFFSFDKQKVGQNRNDKIADYG